jgi:hypothetical protein
MGVYGAQGGAPVELDKKREQEDRVKKAEEEKKEIYSASVMM